MASQVNRFDPFRSFPVEIHKGLGVPNEGPRYGCTAACETDTQAAEYLARGAVMSGHLSGHRVHVCGDLLRDVRTWKLSASFSTVPMILSILV